MAEFTVDYKDLIEHPSHYRILRKITPYTFQQLINDNLENYNPNATDIVRLCVMDFETTGFKAGEDKPIELGLLKLDYSPSQNKLRLVETLRNLEDPGFPLPEIITRVTGLQDEMLKGQQFDDELIADFLSDVQVMVAHNAGFDRPFFDIRFPALANMKWVCTLKDVDWYAEGFESSKLEYLLYKHGYFYDGHNALNDCYAVGQLFLDKPAILTRLLEQASQPSYLVQGFGIPFEQKDVAKANGFAWDPAKKVWHLTVKGTELQAVNDFLAALPGANPARNVVTTIAPEERYK